MAIMFAVMMGVVAGLMALVIDLGRAYTLSTELENAADAYALAGASQLDRAPGACTRAIRAAVDADLANTETFASNGSADGAVFLDPTPDPFNNATIRFLVRLVKDANGRVIGDYVDELFAESGECDAHARFIEVTVDRASPGEPYRVDHAFAALVGAVGESFPKGYAVAGVDEIFCGVLALMMCEFPDMTYREILSDPSAHRGRGIWLKSAGNGTQWGPGGFGLLSVEGALNGGGANAMRSAMGMVSPPTLCLEAADLEVISGNSTAAGDGFNTRFDIYQGALAERRGDAQWQPAANTVKGRIRAGCDASGWAHPAAPYAGPGTIPDPPVMSMPRDNCAYPASAANPDGGTCLDTSANGGLGGGVWDYQTYMQVNHPGVDPAAARVDMSPTGDGLPPYGLSDGLTRYDVYRWELGHTELEGYGTGDYGTIDELNHHLVDNIGAIPANDPLEPPVPLGTDPALSPPQTAEYGGPQCYSGPMGDNGAAILSRDRRVVALAMIDCQSQAIQGPTSGVKAEGFVEVFAVEPWTAVGAGQQIYVELIGPIEADSPAGETVKRVIQLYE